MDEEAHVATGNLVETYGKKVRRTRIYSFIPDTGCDSVRELMFLNDIGSQEIPASCTSKVQVIDVSVNRPFKAVVGECWPVPNFKLSPPTSQHIQYTPDNSNLQGTDENGSSQRMFELSGVNYEEVLEQGDSILVRVIAGSSYRRFELSGLYCS